MQALKSGHVQFDIGEHYEKMSFRNRYVIAGGNGMVRLSIPLQAGRGQRTAMKNVAIANSDKWQQNHWRTLVSAYSRAPYWEYYASMLEDLYKQEFALLKDFNEATIRFVARQLKLSIVFETSGQYIQAGESCIDLRAVKPATAIASTFRPYHQVFEERNGFLPNLSILDLLFAEGPYSAKVLEG